MIVALNVDVVDMKMWWRQLQLVADTVFMPHYMLFHLNCLCNEQEGVLIVKMVAMCGFSDIGEDTWGSLS